MLQYTVNKDFLRKRRFMEKIINLHIEKLPHNTKKVAWGSFMTFQELVDECQNLKLEELEKLIEILQTMAEEKRCGKTIKMKILI